MSAAWCIQDVVPLGRAWGRRTEYSLCVGRRVVVVMMVVGLEVVENGSGPGCELDMTQHRQQGDPAQQLC